MKFDFEDNGTGPVLLFIPGSYSTCSAWKGVQRALKGTYRTISVSLPGYGGSDEIRGGAVADMSLMSEFLVRVVNRTGDDVHLVGHSFGGLTAFAAVLGRKVSPLSLITFEGNPVFSRRDEGKFSWEADIVGMKDRFEAAFAAGDPDAAGLIIDFWSQPGVFQAMPEPVRNYCRSTAFTNVLDWRSASGFTPLISEYAAIGVPCTIVRGEHAIQPMIDISDGIARQIPNAGLRVVPGAGHFLISTHSQSCAAIIDDHMAHYATASH